MKIYVSFLEVTLLMKALPTGGINVVLFYMHFDLIGVRWL